MRMTSDGRLIQDSDLPFRWDMVILDELAKEVPVLEEQVRELQRKWKAMTMSNTAYDNLSKIQRWLRHWERIISASARYGYLLSGMK